MTSSKEKISLLHSLGVILGSLLLTGAIFFVSYRYYHHLMDLKKSDPKYNIRALIQTGLEKEPLPTTYLVELMDLSLDHPSNLYAIKCQNFENKLLSSPLIKGAAVAKSFPDILTVDYEVRKPIAYLKDYSNTLLSEDGVLLPFKPFFTPKNFPQVFLGVEKEAVYGSKIPDKTRDIILNMLSWSQSFFEKRQGHIRFIDFSRAFVPNKEIREVVILISEGKKEFLIRVSPETYKDNFSLIKPILERERTSRSPRLILDLRIRGIGLVS